MPRLFYASFMLLALAVFLLTRWLMPKPPALAAAAVVEARGSGVGRVHRRRARRQSAVRRHADRTAGSISRAWFSDGKTIVAGLIGAYLAVELAKLAAGHSRQDRRHLRPAVGPGDGVGRWGCFFNGCCYGVETTLPWGVWFRVKTATGSAATNVIRRRSTRACFTSRWRCVLWQLMQRGLLPGQRLKLYLIAYGVYRFLTEYIRPEPAWWLGLTFYQWAAAALAAGMIAQWVAERHSQPLTAIVAEVRPAP